MRITKKQTLFKKPAIVAAIVVVLGTLGYGVYAKHQSLWPFTPSSSTGDPYAKLNLSPPTDQEIRDSQSAKKNSLAASQTAKNSSPSDHSKKSVAVLVNASMNAGKLEIRASTPQVIEGSGTCTATVSNSTQTLPTQSTPAFVDATSSICEPIIFSSALSSGDWYVTVEYSSPDAQGISDRQMVTVQ